MIINSENFVVTSKLIIVPFQHTTIDGGPTYGKNSSFSSSLLHFMGQEKSIIGAIKNKYIDTTSHINQRRSSTVDGPVQ